ncbi:hypothetical protein ACJEC8_00095 [Candidatus Carsonella ruddii]|uniref:hypothetical protein n=1 Tax=Carsonella ruddii TaxID=114186 RepID=UPI003D585228
MKYYLKFKNKIKKRFFFLFFTFFLFKRYLINYNKNNNKKIIFNKKINIYIIKIIIKKYE